MSASPQGRGEPPLAGGLGCPLAHKGRPEGIAPSGRRSGCPLAHKGRPEGIAPSGRRSLGGARCPPASPQGASRGDRPLWQEVWGVRNDEAGQQECRGAPRCQPPLPFRKGCPEGIAPSGRRSGGCPSRLSNYLYACAGYVKIDASAPVTTASLCLLPSPK